MNDAYFLFLESAFYVVVVYFDLHFTLSTIFPGVSNAPTLYVTCALSTQD